MLNIASLDINHLHHRHKSPTSTAELERNLAEALRETPMTLKMNKNINSDDNDQPEELLFTPDLTIPSKNTFPSE